MATLNFGDITGHKIVMSAMSVYRCLSTFHISFNTFDKNIYPRRFPALTFQANTFISSEILTKMCLDRLFTVFGPCIVRTIQTCVKSTIISYTDGASCTYICKIHTNLIHGWCERIRHA